MKFHVYVLRSVSGRYYYGSTSDLPRRLVEHECGKTATTRKDGPWTVMLGHAPQGGKPQGT